jgi:adenosylcobinamide kinase/adenosylcobinamide-phosphate guanylyltransferase
MAEVVLLDCLTMLVTNVMLGASQDENEPDENAAAAAVEKEMEGLSAAIRNSPATWIIVSNEVGLGLVPPYPLGRLYRDLLGRANQKLASGADEVYFMIAGIPVPIHTFRLAG